MQGECMGVTCMGETHDGMRREEQLSALRVMALCSGMGIPCDLQTKRVN